jgi:hypothetical protein
MTDVVIVNLPKMLGSYLPAAPAIFKGACNYLGITSKTIDLNLDFVDIGSPDLIGITEDAIQDSMIQSQCDQLITQWARKITDISPKILSISVFSYYGQYFAKKLAKEIKEKSNCYIIIGGAGIQHSINSVPTFAINLKNKKIIDEYLVGDGEISWPESVAKYFNIEFNLKKTLDIPFYPDYSDYELDRYKKPIWIPVTGSRGCVRRCDFCEVHQHWRFQQRTAEHIISEIKLILNLVVCPHIHFTDSLVNGSLKEFKKLLLLLVDLQKTHTFTWGGQFIIRNLKEFDEENWKQLGLSGGTNLEIGIETGNEELRFKMNKPFTNADLDYSVECMKKYSIKCVFLFFIGHPLESDDCFDDTLKLLEKYSTYGVISSVQFGYAMAVQPGTPIYDNKKDYGLITTKNPTIWMSTLNPSLTYQQRLDRRIQASDFAKSLGYSLSFDDHNAVLEMKNNIKMFDVQIGLVERMIK